MKKASHKNQVIITALAVMIVVAGYLNFTGQEISTSGLMSTKSKSETSVASKDISSDKESQSKDKKSAKDEKADDKTITDISAEEVGEDTYEVADSGEAVASKDSPGEAVMVSNTIGADYFASSKLSREQTRAKNKETLMDIVNNKEISSADKQAAIKEVAQLTKISEKESAAELMLQAKGFTDAIVSISGGNADVVVNANGLTNQQIAQIEDIVKRKTGISPEKIVITPVEIKDGK